MAFDSLHFLCFLPLVTLVAFALRGSARQAWLLGASYYFYMCWEPRYALLVLASTSLDYFVALGLARPTGARRRKLLLGASLAGNLGSLAYFKYCNFFIESVTALFPGLPPFTTDVLLPVGISFYTFQSLAYTIDAYRGEIPAERSFVRFALYVSYFPQLVAGPIERAGHLLPQLGESKRFDPNVASEGARRILFGLLKKLVIADQMALVVDPVFADPAGVHPVRLWLATYAFALQIYLDFSAYSDIAIGASAFLNVRLRENFSAPYDAASPVEFWKRWHMSLTSWFRDYVYFPLGGNRRNVIRNVIAVFLLSGLWHGANWTFVAWGAWHALLYLANKHVPLPRAPRWVGKLVTFHLVCAGWVLFRAATVSDAWMMLRRMALETTDALAHVPREIVLSGWVVAGAMAATMVLDRIGWERLEARVRAAPVLVRWSACSIAMVTLLNLGVLKRTAFIYFQF